MRKEDFDAILGDPDVPVTRRELFEILRDLFDDADRCDGWESKLDFDSLLDRMRFISGVLKGTADG